jgi:hypothetical protein
MNRREYLTRARELAPRGDALPQTKLSAADVDAIRRLADEREQARAAITARLSNEAIAAVYGVHRRTIEKILSRERI